MSARPTKIFYSYAHEDERHRERLRVALAQLRKQGLIDDWSDRDITPGDDWDQEIDEKLRTADVILLLVSMDFMASDYIWGKELEVAMARHQAGQARVVPLLLSPVAWVGAPFAKFQALPPDAKPIVDWSPQARGWKAVTESMHKLVQDLAAQLPQERVTPHRARWPRPLTRLLGREAECKNLREMLLSGTRLLTITGPVGVGKSHLALEVGASPDVSVGFPDGIHRIDLSTVSDQALLVPSIAREFGVEEVGGTPLWQRIADLVGDQRRLVLLDGFDQVLGAKQVLQDLLTSTSALQIIVTSRHKLNVSGETVMSVEPLPVPTLEPLGPLDVLIQQPSVQLFVDRARSVQSNFAVTPANAEIIARLCAEASGLPLALQLLGAGVAVLSPEQMLEHLPSLVEPLTATISASVDALDTQVADLFSRLSVFTGGFTLDAAVSVVDVGDVVTDLRSLLESSLVLLRTSNAEYRYFMLAPVREYAGRRLTSDPERSAILGRHARYFRELLEKAERQIEGEEQEAWLAKLEPEAENLRAVLKRALDGSVDVEEGLRLAGAMGPLWYVRGQFGEGRRWLERLLAAGVTTHAAVRAKAANFAGILTYHQNDYANARQLLDEGLKLFVQLPDDLATTELLKELGFASKDTGRAKSLNGLGFVAMEQSDLEFSRHCYEESLQLYRKLGDEWGIVWSATDLALVLLYFGESGQSIELLNESLKLQEQRLVRGRSGLALSTLHLAYATAAEGDHQRAIALANDALVESRSLAYKRGIILAAHFEGLLCFRDKNLGEAEKLLRESLALSREVGDRGGMAESLEALAAVVGQRGDLMAAARFRVAAETLFGQVGSRRRRAEYEPVAVLSALIPLTDEATETVRQAGLPPLDQVLDEALQRT